jgi:hypothetical protein
MTMKHKVTRKIAQMIRKMTRSKTDIQEFKHRFQRLVSFTLYEYIGCPEIDSKLPSPSIEGFFGKIHLPTIWTTE